MGNGFSFASVILSYLLVGGGMFAATLVTLQLKLRLESPLAGAAVLAVGAFVGGFIAARASRGRTILEPALGAVAVVGTIVGLAAATPLGKLLWVTAQDQTIKFVGAVGLTGVVGALIGAALSEKLFGESTRSAIPWLLYTALSTFGAALLATLFASLALMTGNPEVTRLDVGALILIGMAAGCLIGGLAVGASARVRPLIAAFLGGGIGVAGFFAVMSQTAPHDRDATYGMLLLAGAGALITLLGTAIGWAAAGRRQAA